MLGNETARTPTIVPFTDDHLDGEDVLPGFSALVAEIFPEQAASRS